MKHLPSSLIERTNTVEVKEYFISTMTPLANAICNGHKNEDHFHDFQNIFGVGYITTLIIYYFNGLSLKGFDDFDIIIKASLLQNYCYSNEKTDNLNIINTMEKIDELNKTHPTLFSEYERGELEYYISLTDSDFEIDEPDDIINNEQLMYQILFDAYVLYPALCFNTKILNDLYLDELSNSKISFDQFKEKKKIDFSNLRKKLKTSFAKIVYKEISDRLLSLCSTCKEDI